MKNKVLFLADFFSNDLLGGAESNDSVLLDFLKKENFEVEKKYCRNLNIEYLSSLSKDIKIVISNFVSLSEQNKSYIAKNCHYIIYEHDHKYVSTRDPSKFTNFKIPENKILNREFYENASNIIVMSNICKKVLEENLSLSNVINIGTSLWTKDRLALIEGMIKKEKKKECAVVDSENPIKGKHQALAWCKNNNVQPDLISSKNEEEFLEILSNYEKLIFVPQVLETFNRLCAEAKMLECKVVTNKKLIGFASEESFKLSGKDLIEETRKRVEKALQIFSNVLKKEIQQKDYKVSAVLLVWKRVESTKTLIEQVKKYKQIDEIILWNNNQDIEYTREMLEIDNITIINSHINKITFGRYLGASLAKNQSIFVQDDDWNIKDFELLYDKFKVTKKDVVAVCPKTHMENIERNKFVGWGSIFNKNALHVFDKYILKYGEDELLYREADLLFTNCNKYEKFETIPKALVLDDHRSLSLKEEHFQKHYNMLERVKEVKNV